jgi:ubiquinone/menaquinone biosynthesis C-methylase UbiE
MNSRSVQIEGFFDKTHRYLHKDSGVSVRAMIVRSLLGDLSHSRILDLGCGDGRLSLQYLSPTNDITLVDVSANMLEIARTRTPAALASRIKYINADFHRYQADELFDVVICVGVLAHVVSIEDTVAKVAGFLRPGGRCIFQITDTDRFLGNLLVTLDRMRESVGHARGYAVNKTGLSQISRVARARQLTYGDKRQYWPVLPGMGKLPNKWLGTYQHFTLTHRSLSRLGFELVLLYVKEA